MIRVLHASHNGELYKRSVMDVDEIASLVRESHLETLTSADGQIDFWFTPSTHPARWRVNRTATEILLATTRFNASDVPLLRGIVVVAAHTPAGELASLTDAHMQRLVEARHSTSWWQNHVLSVRYAREQRRQRRSRRAAAERATASLAWLEQ
jgi:hypothetical protein